MQAHWRNLGDFYGGVGNFILCRYTVYTIQYMDYIILITPVKFY